MQVCREHPLLWYIALIHCADFWASQTLPVLTAKGYVRRGSWWRDKTTIIWKHSNYVELQLDVILFAQHSSKQPQQIWLQSTKNAPAVILQKVTNNAVEIAEFVEGSHVFGGSSFAKRPRCWEVESWWPHFIRKPPNEGWWRMVGIR